MDHVSYPVQRQPGDFRFLLDAAEGTNEQLEVIS